MMSTEAQRQALQEAYDAEHPQLERNMKGQFATPYDLAVAISRDALGRVDAPQRMLEPSCGTGAFISSALAIAPDLEICGIEKDEAVCRIAHNLWESKNVRIENADFFKVAEGLRSFDVLVTNPPYSRHHHLPADEKTYYATVSEDMSGRRLSQLAGLHAYFILAGTECLRPDGIASWLIPSELFSVNYGHTIREYVTSDVTVERIHFFANDDLQFADALVSSCVLVLRKRPASESDEVEITLGDFERPFEHARATIAQLRTMTKWQHFFGRPKSQVNGCIGDYFKTKRGLSTGAESFYTAPRSRWHELGIDDCWLIPVLPGPRSMHADVIDADETGWPLDFDRAVLSIPATLLEDELPQAIRNYLATCPDKIRNSYTARHRKVWYAVERREPPPIVCTYMSRSDVHPFRFIRNRSNAVVTTTYLCLYPKSPMTEQELDEACRQLNAIDAEVLISSGREYGGGLRKLEPKELLAVPFAM